MKESREDEKWMKLDYSDIHPDEKFEISNYGQIKSFRTSRKGGKIIKGSFLTGYNILVVKLKSEKKRTYFIHKIVADLFLNKPADSETYVIHKDYNRSNNYSENLAWVDSDGMYAHRKADPDYHQKKIKNSKLTEEMVRELKIKLRDGTKDGKKPIYVHIAREFGITLTQLKRIQRGENWTHVTID
ncbi:MAG: hypothetical protein KAG84_05325 [Bacteroidales bacterium]|nr:hypothetical protein [Bacteroidales bacterium]